MKIKPEHLEELKSRIYAVGDAYVERHGVEKLQEYYSEVLYKDFRVKDVNKRFMWDLLNGSPKSSTFICGVLYNYLNDTHIDTALRSLVPETLARYNITPL